MILRRNAISTFLILVFSFSIVQAQNKKKDSAKKTSISKSF